MNIKKYILLPVSIAIGTLFYLAVIASSATLTIIFFATSLFSGGNEGADVACHK